MVKHTVHFVVSLKVVAGKFDEFESIAQAMTATTRKEPGALGYEWYLSGNRKSCRLFETYADADAVHAHITGPAVQELVPKLLETASLVRFEVYGNPSAQDAETLLAFGAEIFTPRFGLKE